MAGNDPLTVKEVRFMEPRNIIAVFNPVDELYYEFQGITGGGLVMAGYNPSSGSQDVNEVAPALLMRNKETGITQLTAPGETADKNTELYSLIGYIFTIANIGTDVVIRLEGSEDGTNFGVCTLCNTAVPNAAITNNQMTVSANGTYIICTEDPIIKAHLDWVSEDGGTPTLDADFFARRK